MKLRLFFLFLLVVTMLLSFELLTGYYPYGKIVPPALIKPTYKVLLLPLDSRPPCQKFVIDAGKIAGIEVITPPAEILDYYTAPGNRPALRSWLAQNIATADAVILSIDQLLHGGLLAAREADGSGSEEDALAFVRELHTQHPDKPIYAFNILPRIHPPASIENYEDRKNLIKYSRLTEELSIFDNPDDLKELRQLEETVPPSALAQYKSLYEENSRLNEKLCLMASQGILEKIIIGQDDSEDFGIPNLEKLQLQRFINSLEIRDDRAVITRGADEVALSLLTDIHSHLSGSQPPKIYVEYSDSDAPGLRMPYMSGSVATSVAEKIRLIHGEAVERPEDADFILFVHIGTDKNMGNRKHSAQRIQELLDGGYKIALVDLSQHFCAEETLLPQLIYCDVPLNQLIAYAGWNTTSNAVGTAISQGAVFTAELFRQTETTALLELYRHNLTLLNNRYLEDYFYLKDLIDTINKTLQKAGYKNVYDLDMEHNYKWANYLLQTGISQRASYLEHTAAYRKSLKIMTPEGPLQLRIRELQAEAFYPWPRTFEIYLQTTLQLEHLP